MFMTWFLISRVACQGARLSLLRKTAKRLLLMARIPPRLGRQKWNGAGNRRGYAGDTGSPLIIATRAAVSLFA
jgi:hypothetical protein